MNVRAWLRGTAYLSAGLMIGAANIASAQEAGWYVGGSAGQSDMDISENAISAAVGGTTTALDETDTAWKVFGGYAFSEFLSVEGGYVDLGEVTFDNTGGNGTSENYGINLVGVGTWPINDQFAVFGKAGVFRWENKYTEAGVETISNGSDATYGLGVRWSFTDTIHVRAEWERFENVGSGLGGVDGRDTDLATVGVVWGY